jgi:eukaryotic-like serine/threonine-protein kinase
MGTMAEPDDDFLKVAVRSGLLSRQTADDLHRSARERGLSLPEMTRQSGALTVAQMEIVETLRRPGEIAPGYELVSLLGEGGMGIVYRARQLAFDRIVALKLVRIAAANPAGLARFEQEARTIGRLVHPHVVTAFDFGKHAGRFFLALEMVDGQDAEQFVEVQHPLAEEVVWHLIRQAASGLAYAAELGVIHRDIKPANLLLVTPPRGFPLPPGVPLVKITDFGLALLQDSVDDRTRLTMEHTTVGSPLYMAPEQLSGSRVDQRADIYALGATAYHLLTGQPPFAGLTLAQTYAQKLHGEPTQLRVHRSDLSTETVALVERLMHRDPNQRLSDYTAVTAAIDDTLATRGSSTMPGSNVRPVPVASIPSPAAASPPARRVQRWIAAALTLCLTGVVALVLFLMLSPPPAKIGPRDWQPTGWGENCFNGRNLDGWQILAGNWIAGQDDGEGGRVLAGSGVIAHPVAKLVDGSPRALAGFRLLALVRRQTAAAVEVQFGLRAVGKLASAERYVVRLTEQGAQVGQRHSDTGPLANVMTDRPFAHPAESPLELRLERQAHEWLVLLDGQLVAAISDPTATRPLLLFAAERPSGQSEAQAWFSDISLEELAPPSTAAP